MTSRPLLAFIATSLLLACASPAPDAPPFSTQNQNKGTTSNDGSSTTAPSGSTGTSASGTALDGTWDVTAFGGTIGFASSLGPSQITVKGGQIDGVLAGNNEGQVDPDSLNGTCVVAKNRFTLTMTVTGDTMTGTFTSDFEYTDPDTCGGTSIQTSNITGTRAHAAANATAQTAVEGNWVITPDANGGLAPFAVAVAGLASQVYDTAQKDDKLFDISVKNGSASTQSDNPDLTFAARKR